MGRAKIKEKLRVQHQQGFEHTGHARANTFEEFFTQMKANPLASIGGEKINSASSDWEVFECPEESVPYYYNRRTGETQWECPAELVNAFNENKQEFPVAHVPSPSDGWDEHFDDESNHPYWTNRVTGESHGHSQGQQKTLCMHHQRLWLWKL